jgi:hypothetical protein
VFVPVLGFLVATGEAAAESLKLSPSKIEAGYGENVKFDCKLDVGEKTFLKKVYIEWVKWSRSGFDSMYEEELEVRDLKENYPLEFAVPQLSTSGQYYCQVTLSYQNGYTITYNSKVGELIYTGK